MVVKAHGKVAKALREAMVGKEARPVQLGELPAGSWFVMDGTNDVYRVRYRTAVISCQMLKLPVAGEETIWIEEVNLRPDRMVTPVDVELTVRRG